MEESNIVVVDTNEFKISKDCTMDPKPENGVYEGKYIIRGKYNEAVAIYNFVHGKREGECKLYDCGSLKEKVYYENDIAIGWGVELERYKEVKWFAYENGEKKYKCKMSEDLEGYWDFVDVKSGLRVKCCKVDEEKKECGIGYVFEEGRIARVVEFVNGKEDRVIKKFDGEGKMTEFDNNGQEVYIGEYCDDLKKGYCREGEGKEIREGRDLVYVGGWKNGERNGFGKSLVDGFAEYEGEWKDGLPDGEGIWIEKDKIVYGREDYSGLKIINGLAILVKK